MPPIDIRISRVSVGFQFFPYPPNFKGRANNGGIDLLENPERIGEITEFASLPRALAVLEKLRSSDSAFMTLGCDAGLWEENFCGYLEFAFRDPQVAKNEDNYRRLLRDFSAWIASEHPEVAPFLGSCVVADIQAFHYKGVFHGDRVAVWLRAHNQEAFQDLLDLLAHFILKEFEIAPE